MAAPRSQQQRQESHSSALDPTHLSEDTARAMFLDMLAYAEGDAIDVNTFVQVASSPKYMKELLALDLLSSDLK